MLIQGAHFEAPCVESLGDMRIPTSVFAKAMNDDDDGPRGATPGGPGVHHQRFAIRRAQPVLRRWRAQAAMPLATGSAAMTSATAAVSFFA